MSTVTVHVAVLPPSTVVTVMVAVPFAFAVTTPFATVATAVLLLLHVTALFAALSGATVATSVAVSPAASSSTAFVFRVTPVTATGISTVTSHVAVLPPSTVVTVMVAVPFAFAVTTPFATVATAGLLLSHVTALFVAFAGATVAASVTV